jgi:hypothetical protein
VDGSPSSQLATGCVRRRRPDPSSKISLTLFAEAVSTARQLVFFVLVPGSYSFFSFTAQGLNSLSEEKR